MSEHKTSTRMAAKHLEKHVRHRPEHAVTSFSGVDGAMPKLKRQNEILGTIQKKEIQEKRGDWFRNALAQNRR